MRIFDSVHGLISFEGEYEDLGKILDTPAFQRLRRVRQLGFADLVYPGATHTRFAHSVGVFKNARDMLAIAHRYLGEEGYEKERARVALLAALLHDIGHGPFSHVFEEATRNIDSNALKHEEWSARIIHEDRTLNGVLKEIGKKWCIEDIDKKVTALLIQESGTNLYEEIVSSQFDADRMDYLQRDARATGIDIGNFDKEWLLDCLRISEEKGKPSWVVAAKGRQAVEAYLLARVQLQESIYFHPTNIGFNIIFRRLMEALDTALRSEKDEADLPSAVNENPVVVYLRERMNSEEADRAVRIGTYLAMDDATAWTLIHTLATEGGGELHTLADCLVSRRSLPCVKLEPLEPGYSLEKIDDKPKIKIRFSEFGKEVGEAFARHYGHDLDGWQYDTKFLDIYSSGGRKYPEVYIRGPDEENLRPLGEASSLIRGLQSNAFFYYCRVYFMPKDRDDKRHDELMKELHHIAREFRERSNKGGRA